MTEEDLRLIAESIEQTKSPCTIPSLRDILGAFGRRQRTNVAIGMINEWLENNKLKSDRPIDEWYPLDESVTIRYRYSIKHSSFQLYSLLIENFKNLHNFKIDFENTDHYCILIGLNGSGKSNVLEAISAIFYHLYKGTRAPFNYKLSYILNGNYYEIRNGSEVNHPITSDILPKNIVVSYSGEDDRMWNSYYLPFYETYCKSITEMPNIASPQMLYVSKEQWEIAFLALLYARRTDPDLDTFIKSIIGDNICTIEFSFNARNLGVWKETIGKDFVQRLKNTQIYSEHDFCDLIDEIPYINSPSALFSLLYQTTVKQGTSPIDIISITIPSHGDLISLSEGEKKMIVIRTIMDVLSSEQSLCLFDEPDSHVHVSRKKEMLQLIDTENRFSVLTTHSPVFIDDKKLDNIQYVAEGKIKPIDPLKSLNEISGGVISYIDATNIIGTKKKILLTEGSYDKKYLEKAIDVLSTSNPEYRKILQNVTIIKTGGTGDTKTTYDELIANIIDYLDRVVFLFDYDKGGLEGWNHVIDIQRKATPEQRRKIIPLFYQQDYTTSYNSSVKNIKAVDSYMVEDLFNSTDYSKAIEDLLKCNEHKDFRIVLDNSNGPATNKIKHYIENNYSGFTDYSRFIPVLNKLIDVFNL